MTHDTIDIGLILFGLWIGIMNIIKFALRKYEERSNFPRQSIVVTLLSYDNDKHPPSISVQASDGSIAEISDYTRSFEGLSRAYIGKKVFIEFSNRYTGVIWLKLSQQIYTIKLME